MPTTGRKVTRKTLDTGDRQGVCSRLGCPVRLGTTSAVHGARTQKADWRGRFRGPHRQPALRMLSPWLREKPGMDRRRTRCTFMAFHCRKARARSRGTSILTRLQDALPTGHGCCRGANSPPRRLARPWWEPHSARGGGGPGGRRRARHTNPSPFRADPLASRPPLGTFFMCLAQGLRG